jgi:hypothetical protein
MKLSFLISLTALAAAAGPVKSPVANIDSSNYLCHVHRVSDEDPEETFSNYIGTLAKAGFQTAVFCVCSKRTNYASDVWESWWSGFDPELGVDQPFFKGTPADEAAHWFPLVKQYQDFHARGFDYPALAIRLARGCGLSPWLSVRLNDVHNGPQAGHFKHGSFVKAHPDFRRQTGRSDFSSYALDFARQEVREHYLKLIRELLARYDMDGLELDFMREPFLFSDGEEAAGARILTGWLTEKVRPLIAGAAARQGRPVLLSARVPSDPDTATALGLDVKAWIDAGLFDVLIPSPRWATLEFDMPWEKWRTLCGAQARPALLAGMEASYRPCLGVKQRPVKRELLRGAASAALAAGADGIYTFNFFPTDKRLFLSKTPGIGSLETLLGDTRTHAVTYRDLVAPTEKVRPQLPFSKKEGTIRLAIAPVAKDSTLTLTIGILLKGEPFRAPDLTLGGHPLSLDHAGANAHGLVTAAGTMTVPQDLPAGELLAQVSWGKRKPAEIRSVELTVTPKSPPPLKTASSSEAPYDGLRSPLLKTVTFRPMHGKGSVTVAAKVFADAMYEGDLMAAAGVSNRIGREARRLMFKLIESFNLTTKRRKRK